MTEERKQFLRDVLITALEGGISYWAEVRNLKKDVCGEYVSFEVRDCEDPEDDWQQITLPKVSAAIRRICDPVSTVEVGDYWRKMIAAGAATYDAGEIDCEGADVIVQVAAYGKIVFA